ncbi:PP2C family protein-serine/threonine phosphatase [Sorangium cellulosum]|uniref:PP2C family protein-serine/threonine phosphatase n=1 Tax=Sorangium cellulosum TaxID=56 RepID=UPI003D9A6499
MLALLSLTVTTFTTVYSCIDERRFVLASIEAQLAAAAHGARRVFPHGYHGQLRGAFSIPKDFQRVREGLRELAATANVENVYAVMLVDGTLRFTADSDANCEFFDVYEEAPAALLEAVADGQPRFAQPYKDRYGTWVSYFYPISSRDGDRPVVFIGVDMDASKFERELSAAAAWRGTMGVILFLVTLGLQFVIVNQLVSPLGKFSRLSVGLTKAEFKFTEEERRSIDSLAARGDEIGELASSLVFMESQLHRFILELARTSAQQQKEEAELAIARDMQLRMVPHELAPVSSHRDIDIFGVLEPAKAVGGDLYDFFMIDEHRLFFQIGDVSDKGIHAALFMSMTKALLKAAVVTLNAPISETMGRVNEFLVHNNASQMFVTLFAGILDLRTGLVSYTDAGHEVPLVLRVSGDVEELPKKAGLPLAVDEESTYTVQTLQLNHGDCLLLYTDGVREGMNANREQFSRCRMVKCMRSVAAAAPPREIISTLLERLREFVNEAPQSDDIAVLAIRYLGDEGAAISVSAKRARPIEDKAAITQDVMVNSRP